MPVSRDLLNCASWYELFILAGVATVQWQQWCGLKWAGAMKTTNTKRHFFFFLKSWKHRVRSDANVLNGKFSLEGSARRQNDSNHFKGCGSYGPWICRICRGRRSRPVGPGPALFRRWSWRRQTWRSSEGRLRGSLLQLRHRAAQRPFNTFARAQIYNADWTVDLLELAGVEVELLTVGAGWNVVLTVELSTIVSQWEDIHHFKKYTFHDSFKVVLLI